MTKSSFKPRSQIPSRAVYYKQRFSRQKTSRRRFRTSLDTITEYEEISEVHNTNPQQLIPSLHHHVESIRKGHQNSLCEVDIV